MSPVERRPAPKPSALKPSASKASASSAGEAKPRERKPRGARPIASEEALKEMALRYVARFPCTSEKLRRHLGKKLRESVQLGATRPRDIGPWIESVVATLVRIRMLDDKLYAELRARTLHRRGRAQRFIARDLQQRHAEPEAIGQALETLVEETPDTDLVAAIRLAKKRRLGPFGDDATRVERRARHLATMARSGFAFAVARQVIDARDTSALVAMIER